jgi:hypothetical protein
MHGGAPDSGAPLGNTNALKTGFHTHEARAERKAERENIRTLLQHSRDLIKEVSKRQLHGVKRVD